MDEKNFFQKLSTPGDVGSFGLGFTIGFLVDTLLYTFVGNPLTTGFAFGVGAVGFKNVGGSNQGTMSFCMKIK